MFLHPHRTFCVLRPKVFPSAPCSQTQSVFSCSDKLSFSPRRYNTRFHVCWHIRRSRKSATPPLTKFSEPVRAALLTTGSCIVTHCHKEALCSCQNKAQASFLFSLFNPPQWHLLQALKHWNVAETGPCLTAVFQKLGRTVGICFSAPFLSPQQRFLHLCFI
jgi:hypothetical protein